MGAGRAKPQIVPLNREAAQRHANELLRLGELHVRLGENAHSERILDEAATAFCKLGSPSNRERAAAARVTQANLASVAGRFDDALAIIDGLVEQAGGFPKFEESPDARPLGIDTWLFAL